METRIEKWGDSMAVRIPQSVAVRVGVTLSATVELTPRGDQIVISLVQRPGTELDDVLARVTEDNLQDEVETGPSVGGEARRRGEA